MKLKDNKRPLPLPISYNFSRGCRDQKEGAQGLESAGLGFEAPALLHMNSLNLVKLLTSFSIGLSI